MNTLKQYNYIHRLTWWQKSFNILGGLPCNQSLFFSQKKNIHEYRYLNKSFPNWRWTKSVQVVNLSVLCFYLPLCGNADRNLVGHIDPWTFLTAWCFLVCGLACGYYVLIINTVMLLLLTSSSSWLCWCRGCSPSFSRSFVWFDVITNM